ncbi:hypothetical protein B0A49_11664 [Cryomyces minteri]|uniref:Uncharacterized protein n=1 Tax=Cryomyces minteri TaxID=331657 RepID=A0A4U0VUD4_9PEZI|nr:hypothetical protein B0A49_11664 [Cryomyces minteri]
MATTSTERLIQLENIVDTRMIEHTDGWPLYGLRPKKDTDLELIHDRLVRERGTKSNFEVYLRDKDMPERYHFSKNQRIAPLWIVPQAGWAIVTQEEFDMKKQKGEIYRPRGLHGYDHEHPLMRAIFVARGPAFPHQPGSRLDVFQNIEVYNIVCDSIGVVPRSNNGTLRLPLKPVGLHSDEGVPQLKTPPDFPGQDQAANGIASIDTVRAALYGTSVTPLALSGPSTTGSLPSASAPARPIVNDGANRDAERNSSTAWWDWVTGKYDSVKDWSTGPSDKVGAESDKSPRKRKGSPTIMCTDRESSYSAHLTTTHNLQLVNSTITAGSSIFDGAPIPLTFGIELEAIFCFHEDRLSSLLTERSSAAIIVKNVAISDKNLEKCTYAGARSVVDKFRGIEYRPYIDEPLQLVRHLVSKVPGRRGIHVHAENEKQTSYQTWSISVDGTLNGLTKADLVAAFPDRIPDLAAAADFDSYGIELITHPYSCATAARDDIAAVISSLRGSSISNFGVTTNLNCGAHVHVGLPDGGGIPLSVVQHLAYLVVVYEDEISALHAPSRRLNIDHGELSTNREAFFAECPEPVEKWFLDPLTGVSTLKKMEPTYLPLAQIRRMLFDDVDKTGAGDSGKGLRKLCAYMGHKGHLVNFSYLTRTADAGPRTLEFRQHAGTLEADDVYHWVLFCTGLVRLAYRYAETGTDSAVESWDDTIDIELLWSEMGLPEASREFLRQKAAFYREVAPDCHAPPLWREYAEFADSDAERVREADLAAASGAESD